MKKVLLKISNVLKLIFGYGVFISVFAGGFTFFGYLVALIIGGEVAANICMVLYKNVIPIIVKISTISVFIGLISMYFSGEKSLISAKKRSEQK
jgi:hypothetical protein